MSQRTGSVRLGRQLRRLRLARGLSQRGLARALGLSAHSNLVQYELGRRIPPRDIVDACERLLGDGSGSLRRLLAEALAERAADVESLAQHAPEDAPAMLPASVADFTGRAAQLRRLATLASPGQAPAVVVVAITGMAGVGKTALAIRFAYEVRGQFPDGQLYLNLGGCGPGAPMSSIKALASLLHALGVPPDQVPVDTEQASALYRSRCAGKRLLVVLDDVGRADQVRPLLPGEPGTLVVVSSRDRLSSLIAHDGARRLTLDVLSKVEAGALLARIIGRARITAEPDAAAELADLCSYLPLALRIAAANLMDQPQGTMANFVSALRSDHRLDVLTVHGDKRSAVRVAFASSYRRLPRAARRMFRLLGLLPVPDFTSASAAQLAGVTPEHVGVLLSRLAEVHLIAETVPGRFTYHDLLRQYAADRARSEESQADRDAALNRWYVWHLVTVHAAAQVLYPTSAQLKPPADASWPLVEFDDDAAALAWLRAEQPNLVILIRHTATPAEVAWRLADALRGYFWIRVDVVDWLAVANAGVSAAEADGDQLAQASAGLNLADALQSLGRHQSALEVYTKVLASFRDIQWVPGESSVLNGLGRVYWQLDRLGPAASHLMAALEIDRRTGSIEGQAIRLANLGAIHHEMGKLGQAAEFFDGALDLARRTAQRRGEAICLANLAMTRHELGADDDIIGMLEEALAMAREIGDPANESHTLRVIAEVNAQRGQTLQALRVAHTAVEVAAGIADPTFWMETLTTLAKVHAQRGELATAEDQFRQALRMARQTRTRYPQIVSLIGLAGTHQAQGQYDKALLRARQARELAAESEYRVLQGDALTILAKVKRELGHPDEAAECALQALGIQQETGHRAGADAARSLLAAVATDLAS